MTHQISRFFLINHITFSVGWLGAIAVFITLAVTALTTMNIQIARSALLAMDISAWYVIVPFCLISLLTGLVQAFGTKWGLFKHYWIVVKLFLTIVMTILLLLHMQPISYLASVAIEPSFSNTQYASQIIDIISKAGLAVLVLVATTTISVYKPWGKITRNQFNNEKEIVLQDKKKKKKKSWTFYLLIGLALLILFVIIKHLSGGGTHGH